jgi:ABC-2 type transport system permease protein
VIAVVLPFALFASMGRGYLLPMGLAVLTLMMTNLVAIIGWGEYFPWAVPALRTGTAGPQYANLGMISYVIVILTSLAGMIGTFVWWELADQTY